MERTDSYLFGLILLLGGVLLEVSSQTSGPIVDTQYGQILGLQNFYNGSVYEEFLGIPFAAPPVGSLRWEKPQPAAPWAPGIWNATEFSIACTQTPLPGSGEDCLYLNVWVPNGVSANEGRLLPVMVFIYGGAYIVGSTNTYAAHGLALHGDVVVVSFNYRVSTLGWLSTGDSSLPGNYGLWDVQAGLQWVKDNIQSFNGDPDQVTIFGQSAGGAIVSHTVISQQTNTLFKNAFAISGSSTGYFGYGVQPLRLAMQMSGIFNCSANNTQDIEDCLRLVGPHTLAFWGLVGNPTLEHRLPSLVPVVDGDFVVRKPQESFDLGEGNHVNFITGSCYHDAALFVLIPGPASYNLVETNETMIKALRFALGMTENADELIGMIFQEYPDINTSDNDTRLHEAIKGCTEWWFGSASNYEAKRRLETQASGKTFHYQFRHRQSFLFRFPDWVNGSHADDLFSIFGPAFTNKTYDEYDLAVSNKLMDYVTNFAHTGDPNVGPFTVEPEWLEYNPLDENYLQESPTFSMNTFYEDNIVDRYRFWVDFPNHWVYPPPPTFPEYQQISEEEIDESVERFKDILFESIEDEEARMEWEKIIDGFVEDRKLGFPINS